MRAAIRSRTSPAARRPKVSTRTSSADCPAVKRPTTDSTIVVVLPVPGLASTRSGPSR